MIVVIIKENQLKSDKVPDNIEELVEFLKREIYMITIKSLKRDVREKTVPGSLPDI